MADVLGAIASIINRAEHCGAKLLPRLEKAKPEAYRLFTGMLMAKKPAKTEA
jgi:hypothetical protein